MAPHKKTLSLAEAADLLALSAPTVRAYIDRGILPGVFLPEARSPRVPMSRLDAALGRLTIRRRA